MGETSDRTARVAKISRWMAGLCVVLAIAIPFAVAAVIFLAPEQVIARRQLAALGITVLDLHDQVIVFAFSVLFSLPLIWGLFQLRTLFRRYAAGDVFSKAASGSLYRFALALLLHAFANFLSRTIIPLALTMQNPPGERKLAIAISSDDVSTVFIAVTFMVIAWVMAEAAEVSEENRTFV
jgi:hypothetical protein